MSAVAEWTLETLVEGQQACFETTIDTAAIDAFAAVSGDNSPLHIDPEFAERRGFGGRVAHGVLLAGLVSRLVGVHLPGRDCLLLDLQMKFVTPVLAGQTVRVTGVVDQISQAARAAILKVVIDNLTTGALAARGKATVGFTHETAREARHG